MDQIIPIIFLGYLNIFIFIAFVVLGIYALVLLIKALKTYIKKNS